MLRGDGRLQAEPADPAVVQVVDQGEPLEHLRLVPAVPVLVGQQHEAAGRVHPGVPAGVGEQHQREQPADLRLVGHQRVQDPAQVQGAGHQVGAHQVGTSRRRVPGREHRCSTVSTASSRSGSSVVPGTR